MDINAECEVIGSDGIPDGHFAAVDPAKGKLDWCTWTAEVTLLVKFP